MAYKWKDFYSKAKDAFCGESIRTKSWDIFKRWTQYNKVLDLTAKVMTIIAPNGYLSRFGSDLKIEVTKLSKEKTEELLAELANMPETGLEPNLFI